MNDKGFEAPQNFVYLSARTYQLGQDINTRYQQQLYFKVLFLNLVLRLLTDDFAKGESQCLSFCCCEKALTLMDWGFIISMTLKYFKEVF